MHTANFSNDPCSFFTNNSYKPIKTKNLFCRQKRLIFVKKKELTTKIYKLHIHFHVMSNKV